MRLSRPCYDKFHRCPGWNGGGPKYPRGESRCDNGRIQVVYRRGWEWKFWPCDTCNVVVWPYATRWLSIPWLINEIRWKLEDMAYEWRRRRGGQENS